MSGNKSTTAWNPYLCGSLAGVLAVLSVVVSGKYLGASTTFVKSVGLIEGLFAPDRVAAMDYFIKNTPRIDWQWMFVAGIFIGSLLASALTKTFKAQAVPAMWARTFGEGRVKRGVAAFLGGILVMFGARLAGGCPSGHGLSGVMQMSLSGIIALVCFFAGGVIMARLIYGRAKR